MDARVEGSADHWAGVECLAGFAVREACAINSGQDAKVRTGYGAEMQRVGLLQNNAGAWRLRNLPATHLGHTTIARFNTQLRDLIGRTHGAAGPLRDAILQFEHPDSQTVSGLCLRPHARQSSRRDSSAACIPLTAAREQTTHARPHSERHHWT
jgi:hypothetical protein